MLAFSIAIYRQADEHMADLEARPELCLASWMAGADGIHWLNVLVAAGKATQNGDGYPLQYWARAADVLPIIGRKPPPANRRVVIGEDYVMSANAVWDVKSNTKAVQACADDAPLYIEVWDMD